MKINKNDVFYTKIDGEVYAMRFKAIVVGMGRLNERELRFNGEVNDIPKNLANVTLTLFKYRFSELRIIHIVAEFAPTGEERMWHCQGVEYFRCEKTFNPYAIYRTIKDCIAEVHPLFEKGLNNTIRMTDEYCVSLDDITPSNITWEYSGRDIYGNLTYDPYTYIWNEWSESKVERKHVSMSGTYMTARYYQSNMLYNIISDKLIFSDWFKDDGYKSDKECRKYNDVKVHLFID